MANASQALSQTFRRPSPLRHAEHTPLPESRLDRVRLAAVAFMRGTSSGWGRRELAEWLVCHYSPCTAKPLFPERADESKLSDRTVDETTVERVILDARMRALRLLGDLVVPWQACPITRLAVASGIVLSERDQRGAVAYSPVGKKKMRLSERVASLFIADYLNQPTEYRWVMTCRECGELSFATELEHGITCDASPDSWKAFTAAEAIATAATSAGDW